MIEIVYQFIAVINSLLFIHVRIKKIKRFLNNVHIIIHEAFHKYYE